MHMVFNEINLHLECYTIIQKSNYLLLLAKLTIFRSHLSFNKWYIKWAHLMYHKTQKSSRKKKKNGFHLGCHWSLMSLFR